ncbi:B12-binding domain-containing radical SAM protein, partial [Patescibacteria group bacterium]|nr:B12-binding domain-containing radical SAM protein [Patescibacteria group bacterium]
NAREFIDLNRIPKTPWELVDVEKYVFKHEKEEKTIRELDIGQTSRGCPGSCYFCYNMIVHKSKWRGIKPKKVLEQIKTVVKKYRLDAIIFRDDDFFADLKRVEEICKLLIKEKLNIKWYASGIRINQFNQMSDKLITILKESGCTSFRFGVESGSPRILKLINKNINPEDVIKANNKCKKFRIAPHYSFIVGFPTETKKDFLMTVELIDKLKRDNSKAIIHGVNIFTPFPGTVLFKICKKEGLKEPIKIGEWVKFHHLKFLTPKMSKKEKQIVKSIHNLSYFTSQITYDNLPKTLRIISYPLKKWAEYRWKKRWFEFTPEIKIINMLRKIIFKF